MRNTELLDFYNLLLSIEVTIFSIMSATLLVFIQIVHSRYTHRNVPDILKDPSIRIFLLLGLGSIGMTLAGSFFLSVGTHNFFPAIDFNTRFLITNNYYVLFSLFFAISSSVAFMLNVKNNIVYLHPARALFIVAKKIRPDDIRQFLWQKTGGQFPTQKVTVVEDAEDDAIVIQFEDQSTDDKHHKNLQIIARLRSKNDIEDPLLVYRDMAVQFIQRLDFASLSEALRWLDSISKEFIAELPSPVNDEWDPETLLAQAYTENFINICDVLLDIAKVKNLSSAEVPIYDVSYNLATHLYEKNFYFAVSPLLNFWCRNAADAIEVNPKTFIQLTFFCNDLANRILNLDQINGTEKHHLDEIHRSIGWLGEKVLASTTLKPQPIIGNLQPFNEFDSLVAYLTDVGNIYTHKHPTAYPLIYFDAIETIISKLVAQFLSTKESYLREQIEILFLVYSFFNQAAIKIGNSRGAYLSSLRIFTHYQLFRSKGLDKEANDALEALVRAGVLVAGYKHKFIGGSPVGDLESWISDRLVELDTNLSNAVMEAYIKVIDEGTDHKNKWSFITTLGKRVGSNFGLMFDPKSGETYPDGDPKRT